MTSTMDSPSSGAEAGKDYITGISPEVLQMCFEPLIQADLARDCSMCGCDKEKCVPSHRHKAALRLSLVCRLFAAIVRPMLFSDIIAVRKAHGCREAESAEVLNDLENQRVEQLLCTIRRMPELRGFVKRLTIDMITLNWFVKLGPDGLTHFTALRKLTLMPLKEKLAKREWESLIAALRQLPNLMDLTLDFFLHNSRLRFSDVTGAAAQLKHLSRLTLRNVECPSPPPSRRPRPGPPLAKTKRLRIEDEHAAIAPLEPEGTAGFTELHINEPCRKITPLGLEGLLRWSKGLTVFTLGPIGLPDYGQEYQLAEGYIRYPWTFDVLRNSLRHHWSTLRELRVGFIGCWDGQVEFGLHEFTALQTFQAWSAAFSRDPAKTAQLWLTPTLRHLILNTAYDDSQCGRRYIFRPKELEWLTEFARVSACRRAAGEDIALQKIEIVVDMEADAYRRYKSNPDGFPDFLPQKAKVAVEEFGFECIWTVLDSPLSWWNAILSEHHDGISALSASYVSGNPFFEALCDYPPAH